MKSSNSTPASVQKPRRNHLDEFLPLYKKFGESNADLQKLHKTTKKHRTESPEQPLSSKHREKHALDMSQIIIDGTNLYSTGGSSPVNESKITSTPLWKGKKGKFKKNSSTSEYTVEDVSTGCSSPKSQKRSKSVSFLLEEKDKSVVKKSKSDDAKHKNNKKSEKENKTEADQLTKDDPSTRKKVKKSKDKAKSKTEDTPNHYNKTDEGDCVTIDKKKKSRKVNKEEFETESNQVPEKTKKAKKQKHHDDHEGEPVSKSPKTEFIANLENLNLGDNTHTLTNLIDEMAVIDKAKQKKLRKTANREKKLQINQNETETKPTQNDAGDSNNEVQAEKKKWLAKRWNKRQVAERDQNTTINVDNLPVSLLKGNFKKILIDHFSKYGLSRSVGEPFIQNEHDTVFTTKIFFNTADAATEALEMNGTNIAGNVIRVSPMRPMTETVLVIRLYGHPDKLNSRDVRAAFHEVGLIRSIRPMLRKKKTMATAFIEFDGPETLERAMQKCADLYINDKKVMSNPFTVRTNEKKKKRKRGSKKKGGKNSENVPDKGIPDEDSSDDTDDE